MNVQRFRRLWAKLKCTMPMQPQLFLSRGKLASAVWIISCQDYGHLLFEDGEPLTFAEFMEGMMTLRGSNQTTVKDSPERVLEADSRQV